MLYSHTRGLQCHLLLMRGVPYQLCNSATLGSGLKLLGQDRAPRSKPPGPISPAGAAMEQVGHGCCDCVLTALAPLGKFGVDSNTIVETRRHGAAQRQYKEHKGRGTRTAGSQIIWERDRSRTNKCGGRQGQRTETWGALHPPTGALLTSWKSACPAAGTGCRGG